MKMHRKHLLPLLLLLALPTLAHGQFTFTTNSGAITITGYNTAAGRNMVIPATTNGYPVTRIEKLAFQSSAITNVSIPNSIISIGDYAFYGCGGLTNATLPASVTNLGRVVFNYCLHLTNITVDGANPAFSSAGGVLFDKAKTSLVEFPCGLGGSYPIPGSVTNLGFAALSSTLLTSVTIPGSVATIWPYAFYNNSKLTNITVDGANPAFSSLNGSLFDKAQETLLQFPGGVAGSFNLPGSVVHVADHAFAFSSLTSVTLSNKVASIGYASFESCLGLTTIIVPGSVTNLGIYAFMGCDNITNAFFLGNAPHDDGVGYAADAIAFYNDPTTVYYLPGTTGWGARYGAAPAVLWNPRAVTPGFIGGHFGFNLTGPTNAAIVVEASTNLSLPVWLPVATNSFSSSGTSTFSDSSSGSYPIRFYRLRSP